MSGHNLARVTKAVNAVQSEGLELEKGFQTAFDTLGVLDSMQRRRAYISLQHPQPSSICSTHALSTRNVKVVLPDDLLSP